jgi:acetyl esterase/lipase
VSEYAAPARAINFDGLPPAVTFVGDLEPFRDETIAYVDNLRKAGVPVKFEIFKGCYHAFEQFTPKAKVSQKALALLTEAYQYAVDHYFAEQQRPS